MTIGRPRPLPGYPTTLALYPISVRRVRVQGHRLPSDPTSRWAPLPSLAVPVITARGGLAPLTSTTCLAHKELGHGVRSPWPTPHILNKDLFRLLIIDAFASPHADCDKPGRQRTKYGQRRRLRHCLRWTQLSRPESDDCSLPSHRALVIL